MKHALIPFFATLAACFVISAVFGPRYALLGFFGGLLVTCAMTIATGSDK